MVGVQRAKGAGQEWMKGEKAGRRGGALKRHDKAIRAFWKADFFFFFLRSTLNLQGQSPSHLIVITGLIT